jgi:hypothetical protein
MKFSDEHIAFSSLFDTEWQAGPYSAYPVGYQNIAHDYANGSTPWVDLHVLPGNGFTFTANTHRKRYNGIVDIRIFAPIGEGTGEALDIAEFIYGIFSESDGREKVISHGGSGFITCRTPRIQHIGARGNWYQINVSFDFQRDK